MPFASLAKFKFLKLHGVPHSVGVRPPKPLGNPMSRGYCASISLVTVSYILCVNFLSPQIRDKVAGRAWLLSPSSRGSGVMAFFSVWGCLPPSPPPWGVGGSKLEISKLNGGPDLNRGGPPPMWWISGSITSHGGPPPCVEHSMGPKIGPELFFSGKMDAPFFSPICAFFSPKCAIFAPQ